MKPMRVVLTLLALAGTALGMGHGRYLVDKMCWEAKTDPAENDLNTLAGVKKHSSKCLMACLEGKSNIVALKCTEGADPECEVDFEIDVTQASEGVDNATVVYLKNLVNSSNCNNDWEVLVTGGDETPAVGDGNKMWEIGSDGSLVRHDTCAVKEGDYFLVDNACWSNGEDPKKNDLTTLAGVKAHSTGCLKMAMCYQSGYVLVQADDNGVVTKKYSVATGTCSDNSYNTYADCTGASGTWTFSDEEKDLQAQVDAFDAAGCKDNVSVQVQDVYGETAVNGDVVSDADFSLTCKLTTPDEPEDDKSGAAVAGMVGLIAGALLL